MAENIMHVMLLETYTVARTGSLGASINTDGDDRAGSGERAGSGHRSHVSRVRVVCKGDRPASA